MAAKKKTPKHEATLSDVVAQLERIEGALNRLAGALEGTRVVAEAPAQASAAPAAKRRPARKPSPPAARAKPPAEEVAPEPAEAAPPEPREVSSDGEDAALAETVGRLLAAGLIEDVEDCWAALESLTHPKALHGPRSIDHLKAFSWKKLRRTAADYLGDDGTDDFRIDRVASLPSEKGVEVVKVFIESHDGSPAPVTLRRDDDSDGDWRVVQISL